jgi:hypothetical protein
VHVSNLRHLSRIGRILSVVQTTLKCRIRAVVEREAWVAPRAHPTACVGTRDQQVTAGFRVKDGVTGEKRRRRLAGDLVVGREGRFGTVER